MKTVRKAFTLVELLVVIGIIAVLIGILLPSLSKARQSAQTTACLANLRTLGQSIVNYSVDNKGYQIPSFANNQGYWFNILVQLQYVPAPDSSNASGPVTSKNIFFCPSGGLDYTPDATAVPANRTGAGDKGFRAPSVGTTTSVDCWYGINGGATKDLPTNIGVPFHSVWDQANPPAGYDWMKSNMIRHSSEMVMLYDGIIYNMFVTDATGAIKVSGNPTENRLGARHNRNTVTNICFADGHAASYRTAELPGGLAPGTPPSLGAGGQDFDLANLRNNFPAPSPRWRLDQDD
jgi:prepilin-type N-terminal cleavage/methylation domain-containing protein/prepilin-type processing-associated H-X9-DG protein